MPGAMKVRQFADGSEVDQALLVRDLATEFKREERTFIRRSLADATCSLTALVPADRVLVETDAPYLAPVPYRGHENEPAYLPAVGAAVAAARGVDVEAVATASRANAERVFGLIGK